MVAVYTFYYSESDSSAIAKYRLWKAVGSIIAYSVEHAFCLSK